MAPITPLSGTCDQYLNHTIINGSCTAPNYDPHAWHVPNLPSEFVQSNATGGLASTAPENSDSVWGSRYHCIGVDIISKSFTKPDVLMRDHLSKG